MDDIVRALTQRPEPWSAGQIILNITLSFLLGLFVAWVYRATHRQLTVSFSFVNTLVLVAMVMAVVIMVIGNNIARAFGLAGAMSIIRFRTVVKDTRDTAFVFYALSTGMACGTGNLRIALIGTLLVGLFAGIMHWTRHGAVARSSFLLSFDLMAADSEDYESVFGRFLDSYQMINIRSVRMGQFINQTFQVQLKDPTLSAVFVQELSSLEGLHRVTLAHGEEGES